MIIRCEVGGEEEEEEAGLNTGQDQHEEGTRRGTSLMRQLSGRSLAEAEAEVEEDGFKARLFITTVEHP